MKKGLSLLSIVMVLVFVLVACGNEEEESVVEDTPEEMSEQLEVMVTLFAQYDFANQIGGAHVNVQRLVAPGVDVHAYDPTPQDIVAINDSDLFIYTGHEMEPWVHRILDSLDTDDLTILDVSIGVNFLPWYGAHDHSEETSTTQILDQQGNIIHSYDHDEEEHSHDHGHSYDHDEEEHSHDHGHSYDYDEEAHSHDHSHSYDHDHAHDYDPHIWTSPINAIVMVENIQEYLIALMPEHADYFEANAVELIAELEALDQDFRELMENVARTTIYHGGRFALHYLMYEYGIDFVSAPMEAEPDTALIARMITEIEAYDIPVIFHEELVNPQTAEMIAAETGAEALLLHTVHNVSADEIAQGATYISLMRHNLEVLSQALN